MSPTTPTSAPIRRGSSVSADPVQAARELAQAIGGGDAAVRIVYCAETYDPDVLAAALVAEFADAPLVGCTTAGEIGPEGYLGSHGLAGVALPAADFDVDVIQLTGLRSLPLDELSDRVADGVEGHTDRRTKTGGTFSLLHVDGLSGREEIVTQTIFDQLPAAHLAGGSAGDGLRFGKTRVFVDGKLADDAATVTLVSTNRPFEVLKTQHFGPTEKRLVVTDADPERRLVREIDGLPAAEGYARAVGVKVDKLNPQMFSTSPVTVEVGGEQFVRSIQKVENDGSLTFFCAIDVGMVLTVAECGDLVGNLERLTETLDARFDGVDLTLGFDCILRKLEIQEKGLQDDVNALFERLNVCGFATYGEQIGPMHVNQTFTGVAIGRNIEG